MNPRSLSPTRTRSDVTPLGAAGRGALAGMIGSLLMSLLARATPWTRVGLAAARRLARPRPFEPGSRCACDDGGPPAITPAGALARPVAPGPEGLAEQFAFKVGAGVFDRDLSDQARPLGRLVHLLYGAAWGVLFGLAQASRPLPAGPFGAAYGLLVWLVGPGFLVPAMRLMGRPAEEPRRRTATLVAGHVAYGLGVAATFEALRREGR